MHNEFELKIDDVEITWRCANNVESEVQQYQAVEFSAVSVRVDRCVKVDEIATLTRLAHTKTAGNPYIVGMLRTAAEKEEFNDSIIVTTTQITRAAADPDDVQQNDYCRHSASGCSTKAEPGTSKEPTVQPVLQARGRIIPATLQVCLT